MNVPFHNVYPEFSHTHDFVGFEIMDSTLKGTYDSYWILYVLPDLTFKILRYRKRQTISAELVVNKNFIRLSDAVEYLLQYQETPFNCIDDVYVKWNKIKATYTTTFATTAVINKVMEI